MHLTNNLQFNTLVIADFLFPDWRKHQQTTSPKTSLLSSLIMPFPVHWKRFSILWLHSSLLKVLFHLIWVFKNDKSLAVRKLFCTIYRGDQKLQVLQGLQENWFIFSGEESQKALRKVWEAFMISVWNKTFFYIFHGNLNFS